MSHIQPIQSILINDDELPSTTDTTYATLELVDLSISINELQAFRDRQSASEMINNSFISSKGKIRNHYIFNKILIFLQN